MSKKYKEVNEEELETTINVLYGENKLLIYTNKISLQRKLYKILGEPAKEYKVKKSITGSSWEVPLNEKNKISKIILKANIYEL